MEKLTFALKISTEKQFYDDVSNILNKHSLNDKHGWSHEIVFEEQEKQYNVINYFLNILDGKYEKLESLGITRDEINIWIIYAYNYQCNMEFDSKTLLRLGESRIKLCISCFEAGLE
jgi:hypothetical protein